MLSWLDNSQDVSVLWHHPLKTGRESPMSQDMVLRSSHNLRPQTNDYEQVGLELKCAHSASQPKQRIAVRTVSKTGSIIQRAKWHNLPRLPQLLYVLLAVTNISTHHIADKWSFETKLWSHTTGRKSQASGVCIAKVAAASITCTIFHLMDKTLYGTTPKKSKSVCNNQSYFCLELALITFSTSCLELENL